jgi:AmmeMemoRadiSam system protein B
MRPTRIRPPAVAGAFYPADREELIHLVDGLLAAVPAPDHIDAVEPPVALVVPHAGYVYSGPVAATAYAHLLPWRDRVRRVVLIGPAHRVPVRGIAAPWSEAFATPLGRVAVDRAAIDILLRDRSVYVDDRAHAPEHSLEVQLPFLQRVLASDWTLVPLLAGGISAPAMADALDPIWAEPGTLVVVSSDLSHYLDLAAARTIDRDTAALVVAQAWEQIGHDQACGATPLRGALELSRRHDEHVRLLDLRTSGDTAGPDDHVVGYGSFVIR